MLMADALYSRLPPKSQALQNAKLKKHQLARRNILINTNNKNLQINTVNSTTNSEVSKAEVGRNSIKIESG